MVVLYDIIIILYYDKKNYFLLVCMLKVLVNNFFNYVDSNSCLLWLTQYLAVDKVPCSIEQDDSTDGASQTSNPLIPNLMLYQLSMCAPPKISLKDNWTL